MNDDKIVDIDLSATRKKRFRIDGDPNRILELNTSDMGIISRVNKSYKKLEKLADKAMHLQDDFAELTDEEQMDKLSTNILEIDAEMRNILDDIFDSNVSEVCAPYGTMFDFFGGSLRFAHIIKTLMRLYNTNISNEYELIMKKVGKHTDKYTK